jgi:hypothetical protein
MDLNVLNPVREPELKGQLEVVSRVGAVLLLVIYVFGFVVVTFANSSRGISNFGLFRARVLSAGILFSAFLMLPLLDWSRYFGKLGFPKIDERSVMETSASPGRAKLYFRAARLLLFFMSSLGVAWFICLYIFPHAPSGRSLLLYFVFMAVATGALMLCRTQHPRRPVTCAALCLSLTGVGVAGLALLKEGEVGLVVGWFFFVAVAAHSVEQEFRNAQHLRNVAWHWVLLNVVLAPALFGMGLYPKIPSRVGGGQATRVLFQFTNPSPIDGSAKDDLWLLDEVDTGYFVLQRPDEHKAIFLPRSLVSAIYFEADTGISATSHQ